VLRQWIDGALDRIGNTLELLRPSTVREGEREGVAPKSAHRECILGYWTGISGPLTFSVSECSAELLLDFISFHFSLLFLFSFLYILMYLLL
jgi:hypothetical protein